ncbi:MAG: AMP-binding protein [Candidatus Hodarchaeales archaeon]
MITEEDNISYSQLIEQINTGQTKNFFCSFVADIVTNTDINLSSYEMNTKKADIKNLDDLKNRIFNSTAKIIMKTSGTTGKPKIKRHNISFILKNTKEMATSSRWLFTYNKYHMGGVQVLLQAIRNFDTIVDVYRKNREYVFESIKKHSITNISATPTFYRLLQPYKEYFPSVSRITVGGERVDRSTLEIIKKHFPNSKINNIYATTETGAILFSSTDRFILNSKIKIKENTLYAQVQDGTFHNTGDLVEMVDENTFVFCGRNKNIINIAGNNVNPIEIEDILKNHDDIKDAVVYTKENKLLGNVLICDIVSMSNVDEKDIRDYLRRNIKEPHKIPRIIRFKDLLKISDTNKVIR